MKLKDLDARVDKLFNKLPLIAQSQYIKKSLIDEIQFSNDIEGVACIRKDIISILDDLETKNKSRDRFYDIIKKYALLLNSDELNLSSSVLKSYQKTEMYVLSKLNEYSHYEELIEEFNLCKKEKILLKLLIQSELFSEVGLTGVEMINHLKISLASLNTMLNTFKKLIS